MRLIHSVASESALRALERHLSLARPGLRILIEVNVAGEQGKAGVAPARLGELIARAPVPVAGLMAMPPLAAEPEQSRPWFAGLRELAGEHGLEHLSMGTSQDYVVAVEEGATIVQNWHGTVRLAVRVGGGRSRSPPRRLPGTAGRPSGGAAFRGAGG